MGLERKKEEQVEGVFGMLLTTSAKLGFYECESFFNGMILEVVYNQTLNLTPYP